MEIGGVDVLVCGRTVAEVAEVCHRHWPDMWYEPANGPGGGPVGDHMPSVECFVYRDEAAFRRSNDGADEQAYEGMLYLIPDDEGCWMVHDVDPVADVRAIMADLPISRPKA